VSGHRSVFSIILEYVLLSWSFDPNNSYHGDPRVWQRFSQLLAEVAALSSTPLTTRTC
jgi:hypothetical protein